jgi:hypothetical protein
MSKQHKDREVAEIALAREVLHRRLRRIVRKAGKRRASQAVSFAASERSIARAAGKGDGA